MDNQEVVYSVEVNRYRNWATILIFSGAVLLVLIILLFLFKTTQLDWTAPIDSNIFSHFGDLVSGLVGAIWSLASILLFYAALKIQREDLQSQLAEFKKSSILATQQSELLKIQKFENTFFNLLSQHNQLLSAIDLRSTDDQTEVIARGRDCFKTIYSYLEAHFTSVDERENIAKVKSYYAKTYDDYESDLGHYFRHLYHLIKYVKQSDIDDKEKYTSIVRSQLSIYELLLLFYNGLGQHGAKFKLLIEEFHLLKNMNREKLISESHSTLYVDSAYGKVN